jgi:MFS family permease
VKFAGIYAILFALAACATVTGVPHSARRVSSRKMLQVAALVRFLVPLVALSFAFFADSDKVRDAISHNAGSAWLFGVTFLALGLSRGLIAAAIPPYAEGLFPEGTIQRVAQLAAVALAAASLSPLLGAWAWNERGMQAMLLVAALAGFVALLASGSLAKSRTIGVKRRTREAR